MTTLASPAPLTRLAPRTILKAMRAKWLKSRLTELRREVSILERELDDLNDGFRKYLEEKGATVATYRGKPVVMLVPAHQEGYTVPSKDWKRVVYP